MNTEEYEKLQARLTSLQNKKERQPGSGSSWKDGWRDAILAVKSLIHSEFKVYSEWIPVSKKQPEEPGYYLTSNIYGEINLDYWTGENFDRTELVIAWMLLPKPYKAKEEE